MLLHRKKHEFTTSLSKARILAQIRIRLPSGLLRADSEFFGYVTDDYFKVRQNPHYKSSSLTAVRNSFAPIAIGRIEENENGSTVKLTVRMNILVAVMELFIQLFTIVESVVGLIYIMFANFQEGVPFFLFGVCFFLAMELSLYFSFHRPAKRMIALLEEILIYKYSDNQYT